MACAKLLWNLLVVGLVTRGLVRAESYGVATLNADLIPRYEYEARRNTLLDQLATSSADVVCLQGIPSEMDIREVTTAVSSSYPYSWSFIHEDTGDLVAPSREPYSPCSFDDVVDFCVCVDSNCRSVGLEDREAYFDCIFGSCSPMDRFSPRCMECVVDTCFNPADLGSTFSCMLNVTSPGGQLCNTFFPEEDVGSTKGLIMLSTQPLSELARGNILPSRSFAPVGYLRASVPGLGGVVCAHLTPFLGEPFFDHQTGFESYEEQSWFETFTLLSLNENNIIMGDLNFSPYLPQATPIISGRFNHSNDVMERLGFHSLNSALCTVCADNPLVDYMLSRDDGNYILDHIFLRDNAPFSVEEVSVEPYGLCPIGSSNDPEYMSSHYGVTTTLTRTAVLRN